MIRLEPLLSGASGDGLSSLAGLPWLSPPAPAVSTFSESAGWAGAQNGGTRPLLHAGLAAAVAVMLGGAWYLAGGIAPQSGPAVQQLSLPGGDTSIGTSNAARYTAEDYRTAPGQNATQDETGGPLLQALGDAQSHTETLSAATPAKRVQTAPIAARTPAPAPIQRATASPAADGSRAAQIENIVTQSLASGPEGEVMGATRKEFRSVLSKARDGARAVIRLGNRQRPGRDATEEEHTQYRFRRQNAEAAQNYLIYIDTLSRSMKSTQSESVAQQSLAKAHQTLGYVTTMLADSKASLLGSQ